MEHVADHVRYLFDHSTMMVVAIVGIAAVGALWAVIQAFVNALGDRLSSSWLLIAPLLLVVVAVWGLVGGFAGVAETEDMRRAVYRGADNGLGLVWLSSVLMAVTGVIVASAAGLSAALNTGERNAAKTGWGRAVGIAGLGFVGGVVLLGGSLYLEAGMAFQLMMVCIFGGAACGVASLRPSGPKKAIDDGSLAGRTADRVAASVGVVVAVIGAGLNAVATDSMHVYNSIVASTPENRVNLMEPGVQMVGEAAMIGLAGLLLAAVLSVVAITSELDGLKMAGVHKEAGVAAAVLVGVIGAILIGFAAVGDFVSDFEENVVHYEPSGVTAPPDAEI